MTSGRDTPPAIQDGPYGWEPGAVNSLDTAADGRDKLDVELAVKLARESWTASTNWLNSSRRARWNDSLRAFQSLHPSGSKYLSGDYRYRSSLYRPKTRTMVRRDEAATASAFFSNEDVCSIKASDDDDPYQQASAEVLKALLQYRLADAEGDNRIPWFLTLIGARQDADVMGVCISKIGWCYEERFVRSEKRPLLGPDGLPLGPTDEQSVDIYEKLKDHPFIDLIAPENFRFEPGCDWRNVVSTSPYLIEMSPVYIGEAIERMESQRGAPAEWERVSTSALRGANDSDDDITRRNREEGRTPGQVSSDSWKPQDFDICWTRINTIRWHGRDWYFRTLASSGEILEKPRPMDEVFLHGERPYVVGSVNIETHRTYPDSKVELTTDLQRACNQDWNSRFDAVMLALQPRQFVREGAQQDPHDLRMFMPGKTVMINAAKGEPLNNVVTWDRPPPVDGASFQEQDRINLDWDDLVGTPYNNAAMASAQLIQQSATSAHLLSGEAATMSEYELRIFAETFVEPTLRLLVKCEQAYETDEIVLALAGKKAQLFQRFGINQVTTDLLNAGATVRLNVGIGSTNPQTKLRNFATGAQILGQIFGPTAATGTNFQEVCKELFGLLGYKDGERFFQPGFDPKVAMQQQQLAKQKGGAGNDPTRLQSAQIQAQSRLQERQIQQQTDMQIAHMDYQTKMMAQQAETHRMGMKLDHDTDKQTRDLAHEHAMEHVGHVLDQHSAMADQQHQMNMQTTSFDQDQQAAGMDREHQMTMQAMQPPPGAGDQSGPPDQGMPNPFTQAPPMQMPPQMSQQMPQQMPPQMPEQPPDMGPPPGGPPQQGGGPPPQPGGNEAAPMIAQMIAEAMGQLAIVIQRGDMQIASAIQQGDAQLAQALATSAQQNAAVQHAMLGAMNTSKRVVRDKTGKIVSVENI